MPHVALIGDSIFDNARYVPGGPAVIEQLQSTLPADWKATLLAIDGSVTTDVASQLRKLPEDVSHVVISTGGNDALESAGILQSRVNIVAEALAMMSEHLDPFREEYMNMVISAGSRCKNVAICTIYDHVPGLSRYEKAGLDLFNAVILRTASIARIPVIDLRVICDSQVDYSSLSPIEPSRVGGAKIAEAIAKVVTMHPFNEATCVLYGK